MRLWQMFIRHSPITCIILRNLTLRSSHMQKGAISYTNCWTSSAWSMIFRIGRFQLLKHDTVQNLFIEDTIRKKSGVAFANHSLTLHSNNKNINPTFMLQLYLRYVATLSILWYSFIYFMFQLYQLSVAALSTFCCNFIYFMLQLYLLYVAALSTLCCSFINFMMQLYLLHRWLSYLLLNLLLLSFFSLICIFCLLHSFNFNQEMFHSVSQMKL